MIRKILSMLFRRKTVRVIEMPAVFGPRRFTAGELKAFMAGGQDQPQIQAIGQLLYCRSLRLVDAGKRDAWKGADTRYQLGGANAIDELLGDIVNLMETGKVPEDLTEYFKDV